ncbi:hypothetical protein [Photorhabdus asymbiotica]|uniref:hypothetical protein n=1 Tax=Photorhabdus asymbiotica TaxID=291112 RepID=UPI003DA6F7F8
MDRSSISKQDRFLTNVAVTPVIVDGVGANGKHSINDFLFFTIVTGGSLYLYSERQ